MNILRLFIASLFILLPVTSQVASASDSSATQFASSQTERLISALRDGDSDRFDDNSTSAFMESMTPQRFDQARQAWLPVLQKPSKLNLLGTLNKSGTTLYVYRLRPNDGSSDAMVTTAIKGGKVTGFFIN